MSIDPERVHKPIRKLRKFLKLAPKRPSSQEVHRLRTNLRRFEATLEAFGLASQPNEKSLLKVLARVRKRAGKVRDMDVLTGYALGIQQGSEQDCLIQLLETLGAKRAKQAAKLRKLVEGVRTPLRHRLQKSSFKIDKLLVKGDEEQKDSPALNAQARAARISGELLARRHLDKANLHRYRLKVKRLRYILQLADHGRQEQLVDRLGAVKDAIGEWHDWEELIVVATEALQHGKKCKLLLKLKSISDAKYAHALSLANDLKHMNFQSISAPRLDANDASHTAR